MWQLFFDASGHWMQWWLRLSCTDTGSDGRNRLDRREAILDWSRQSAVSCRARRLRVRRLADIDQYVAMYVRYADAYVSHVLMYATDESKKSTTIRGGEGGVEWRRDKKEIEYVD